MARAIKKIIKRRTVAKPGKERILDAAEKLFAHHGFYGVSVRDITEAAEVDVALVSYHFGGKRELFTSLVQRRAEVLNAERARRLDEARSAAAPGVPTLEAIIDSFTRPMLELSARGGAGWKSYFELVAQVNNSPEWGPVLLTQHFDPMAEKFVAGLRCALPECAPREIYWGYQFLSGAVTLSFAETGRIDKLSGGLCKATDLDTMHERLVPYLAAGLRMLCGWPADVPEALPLVAGTGASPRPGRRKK
jgi:AcrR family transcriptional regulator